MFECSIQYNQTENTTQYCMNGSECGVWRRELGNGKRGRQTWHRIASRALASLAHVHGINLESLRCAGRTCSNVCSSGNFERCQAMIVYDRPPARPAWHSLGLAAMHRRMYRMRDGGGGEERASTKNKSTSLGACARPTSYIHNILHVCTSL